MRELLRAYVVQLGHWPDDDMAWPCFLVALESAGVREARRMIEHMQSTDWALGRSLTSVFGGSTIDYDLGLYRMREIAGLEASLG